MAVVKSQVIGLSEANEILKQLPGRVQKRVLQNAVNAGLRVVLKATKDVAPKHEGPQSAKSKRYGTIRENLKLQTYTRLPETARGGRVTTGDAFWAVFYEFGTAHQPARPFMRPASDNAQGEATAAFAGGLIVGVEREAAKLASDYSVAKKSFGVR